MANSRLTKENAQAVKDQFGPVRQTCPGFIDDKPTLLETLMGNERLGDPEEDQGTTVAMVGGCVKCQASDQDLFPVDAQDFIMRKGGDRAGARDLEPDLDTEKAVRWICGRCVRG